MGKIYKKTKQKALVDGIVAGFGWSIGVTLGFAFISTILVFVFNTFNLGAIPLIGGVIADIFQSTQDHLLSRSIVAPQ